MLVTSLMPLWTIWISPKYQPKINVYYYNWRNNLGFDKMSDDYLQKGIIHYFETNIEVWKTKLPHLKHSRVRLIDWLGFNAAFNFVSSCQGDQFTYSCVSWYSHTSTPHNILSKQLAAFPHRLLNSPLVKDITVTFVKRRKECWPSWASNSQPLD